MRHFWSDIRFGVRMLVRYPTLSIVSILTFGLGLGLATSVFSIVNGALYKGLPFDDADRIVLVVGTNAERNVQRGPVSVHDLVVFRDRQTVFEAFGAFVMLPVNLSGDGQQPARFSGGALAVGALQSLRVEPVLGRLFRDGEDRVGAEPVVLLGHRLWQERFAGSPNVIGRTVRANGIARTIVGVMPPGFAFPDLEELWIPLVLDPLATPRGQGPSYRAMGRLRPGISIAAARAQFGAMSSSLEKEFPLTNRGAVASVTPFLEGSLGPQLYALLYTMLGAGIGVLLIACVNVSNLLLARASLRQREVAVRLALGAGRGRVLAQILTEVSVLAVAGALVGLVISVGCMRWFVAAIQSDPPPFFITFDLDVRVLLFVTGVTCAAAVFAGLLPALQATRLNVASTLKDEGRAATGFRAGRFSGALIVAEMTVSCALLIAAGLMVKSVAQVSTVRLPFTVDTISTARINMPQTQYPDLAGRIRFYNQLLPKVQAIPAVEAATLSDGLPASGNGTVAIQVAGRTYARDIDYPLIREGIITPGYFQTFQARVLRGREFTDRDQLGQQMVALVNETFARRFFKGGDPIGRQIKKGRADSKEPWLTIVGLVPDMLMQGFGNTTESPAGYYIPIAQSDVGYGVNIAARGRGGPAAILPALRAAVASLDPDLALYDVRPMQDVVDQQTMFYSVFGTFFFAFGAAGLFLAAAGLYGVMSFAVTQRTREFGIRSALGAQSGQLMLLVMRKAIVQSAIGLTLGLALGVLATGPLQPLLYEVHPRDPAVLAIVIVALSATGLLTGFIATRRVTRLDPVVALGTE
jgi:putative ABC transport system permease protein